MYDLYEYLRDEKICLSYMGAINDNITDKFIDLSEFYMKNSTNLGKLKNKTSFLIAECFQNTIRHREKEKKVANHKDYFQINAWEGGVVLIACNLVQGKHVEDLRKKITHINSLDAVELKKLHDEVLASEGFSSSGGAGLGLIDMARKTGLPLRYNFTSIEKDVSQFFIALEVQNQTDALFVPKVSLYLKREIEFYNTLLKKDTMILYRGEFSKETIAPLMQMLEQNLAGGGEAASAVEKRRIVTLIEVLQNVSKHGKVLGTNKAGIFSIAEDGEGYIVETGNFINKEEEAPLRKMLEEISKMSLEEIGATYKKRLMVPDITEEGNSGLGLLEIARNCSKQFTYQITETPEHETFFSLKIKLQ